MRECRGLTWFVWIGVWMSLLIHIAYQRDIPNWNGCGKNAVKEADICFETTDPTDGESAWKNCLSVQLSEDFLASDAQKLREHLMILQNETGSDLTILWVGGIQAFNGSNTYVTYNGSYTTSDFVGNTSDTARRCLALDISTGITLVGYSCGKFLPMLCAHPRFVGVLHNAEAEDACNFTNAVVVEPKPGCYEKGMDCSKSLTLTESSSDPEIFTHIRRKHPIDINIVAIKLKDMVYFNKEVAEPVGEEFCYVKRAHSAKMRLELRFNKTARALTLFVDKPGRAVWPPTCFGGRVKNPEGDPRALLIDVSGSEENIVWCYVKDFVDGSLVHSNSAMHPEYPKRDCSYTAEVEGLPPDAVVNETASCLRCLKDALSTCPEDECDPECTRDGCGHFRMSLDEWDNTLKRDGGLEGLEECAMDEVCAGQALWELTEGGDCNRDGVVDCDDRLLRIFDPSCNGSGDDPRRSSLGNPYWECRKNPRSDFLDVLIENRTARYYCENYMPLKRNWSGPEFFDIISPYVPLSSTLLSTTSTPNHTTATLSLVTSPTTDFTSTMLPSSTEEPMTEEEAVKNLQVLSVKRKPNVTITNDEMEKIVRDVTKLLDLDERALLKAQTEVNVSSLADLLENILVHVPDDFTFTTPKLAVSKEKAIGFQLLLSDKPAGNGAAFGSSARQVPLKKESDLLKFENKVEAAVILPDLPEGVSLVVVTFAKSDDFIPCRSPLITEGFNNATNTSTMTSGLPSNTSDSATEGMSKACPFQVGIVVGCVNSHILQVGLVNENGSYQQLPDGKHVDLIFRTKTNATLGQAKKCVYWDYQKKGWASDGCELIRERSGLDTCRCTHLTHFAQLVSDGDAVTGPNAHALGVMSICACAVSLCALCGVLSAGVFAPRWRKKKENKIMVNLAVAMSLYLGLFLWSALAASEPPNVRQCEERPPPSVVCKARGAALHYCVLSSFCWMLVAAGAHYLRFTSLTGLAGVPRFVLKSSLVGWGAPVVPVAVLLGVDADTYAGAKRVFCYPSGTAFYGAVLAPICAVLLANAVLFALILRRLFPRCFCCSGDSLGPGRASVNQKREFVRKVLVCVAFVFLFGLTWYLGLLSFAEESAFVFCFVVMCQGPTLLGFFVIGEENVRNKLKSMVRRGIRPATSSTQSSEIMSTNARARTRVRPDQIPLSPQSYNSSTNTTPVSEEIPPSESYSFS